MNGVDAISEQGGGLGLLTGDFQQGKFLPQEVNFLLAQGPAFAGRPVVDHPCGQGFANVVHASASV